MLKPNGLKLVIMKKNKLMKKKMMFMTAKWTCGSRLSKSSTEGTVGGEYVMIMLNK